MQIRASIIQIGNSKGLRLSKILLNKYNIKDSVELILEKGRIIVKPISEPRKGWEQAFKIMNKNGDDKLLIKDIFKDEDFEKWD